MKMISLLLTTAAIDSHSTPPSLFNCSPFDAVRFQKYRGLCPLSARCFCIFFAMAFPIFPSPNHSQHCEVQLILLKTYRPTLTAGSSGLPFPLATIELTWWLYRPRSVCLKITSVFRRSEQNHKWMLTRCVPGHGCTRSLLILPHSSSACMHRDNSTTHDDPDSTQIGKLAELPAPIRILSSRPSGWVFFIIKWKGQCAMRRKQLQSRSACLAKGMDGSVLMSVRSVK